MAYHSNGYNERNDEGGERSSAGVSDKPTYLMEHLATFTVTNETGIVYPADGMRRLLQLEKSNGIWSQKMQLCLDHPWVLIMDYETGTVMERFPASLIQEPTAFTSHDPMEIYNNILVFIVGSSGSSHNPHPEMHIFQCQSISAQELVEDLKYLRSGKSPTGHKTSVGSVPPQVQPPVREREPVISPYREPELEVTGINDETSSTTSEKYERDVTILNHCFDDIEKFIARLQHAAAASRELERRRRNRKSKKKDLGDGMLTMRTKPPPEKEFIDIFQKFKLSFNLLAKLKAHIHDPNAPELIHFLFTPLALIVDASHETFYEPNLPAKVVSPLLTREAVNLLMNCVTSKETELWHSLGNAWLIPRDQWKGHVPSYHPVFMDGWSPEYMVADESESTIEHKPSRESDDPHYNQEYFDYEQPVAERIMYDKRNSDHRDMREPKMEMLPPSQRDMPHVRDVGARSDISIDSIERTGHEQENWLAELQARGANVVQVTYPRTANNDKELTVVRGEYLEVLDDQRKWWKAKNSRGQVAHVPHTIVAPHHYGNGSSDTNDIFNNPLYTHNYNRNHGDAASETFSSTQSPSIQDHQNSQTDWVIKERLGKKEDTYNRPSSIPLLAPPPPPPIESMPILKSFAPAPPSLPPLSAPSSAANTLKRSTRLPSDISTDVNEELKNIWPIFKQKRPQINVKKTPKVFIKSTSTAEDVQIWLKEKSFSENLQKELLGLNGEQILSFNKDHFDAIEKRFKGEGKRFQSQVTLQKEFSGFTIGKNSEFKNILEKAKAKAEQTGEEQEPPEENKEGRSKKNSEGSDSAFST